MKGGAEQSPTPHFLQRNSKGVNPRYPLPFCLPSPWQGMSQKLVGLFCVWYHLTNPYKAHGQSLGNFPACRWPAVQWLGRRIYSPNCRPSGPLWKQCAPLACHDANEICGDANGHSVNGFKHSGLRASVRAVKFTVAHNHSGIWISNTSG